MGTKISWCDETINPVVGCCKVSAGCANCYAEKMAARLAAMGKEQYQDVVHLGKWNGLCRYVPSELLKPLAWKAPRSIFISSMGDLFHELMPYGHLDMVMATVAMCPQHTFIALTKRPKQMQKYFKSAHGVGYKPLKNLVLGVSVEDQATADERIPILLQIRAAKRFVSIEPILGPVDLMNLNGPGSCRYQVLTPIKNDNDSARPALDGVILGGESGLSHKARQLHGDWVRTIRDQCNVADVPFMFKQDSCWAVTFDKAENGFPILDGCTHTALAWEVRK